MNSSNKGFSSYKSHFFPRRQKKNQQSLLLFNFFLVLYKYSIELRHLVWCGGGGAAGLKWKNRFVPVPSRPKNSIFFTAENRVELNQRVIHQLRNLRMMSCVRQIHNGVSLQSNYFFIFVAGSFFVKIF